MPSSYWVNFFRIQTLSGKFKWLIDSFNIYKGFDAYDMVYRQNINKCTIGLTEL